MNCSVTLDCGDLVCFLFVLCHSQDNPPALCQKMEKGISGCSTLTKLSLRRLPPQCSCASVRAAMALQSSLTEVEWSYCDFYGKSSVTRPVFCVWCVHGCVVRNRGIDVYTHLYKFVLVCMVFALCVPITRECSCACVLCVVRYKGKRG